MNVLLEVMLLLAPQSKAALDPEASALADLERRSGRVVRQQEQEPANQELPPLEFKEEGSSFIDFDWLEMQPRVGMAIFSDDYHIDASPSFGVQFRAPMTCLSPGSNPHGEYFGVFAEADAMFIERTIRVDDPKGVALLLTFGFDYSLFRDGTWLLMIRGGAQYATYGGVSDLEDGFGAVAGLSIGLTLSRSLSLTLCPEMVFGQAGDNIILGYAGMVIEF